MDPKPNSDTETTAQYWQALLEEEQQPPSSQPPFRLGYPVGLSGGGVLVLPLRPLPDGKHAVASLIANQASLAVVRALARSMTELARPAAADFVIGVPTLGLALAPLVAQGLGHDRYLPLGYSRKYWYDEALSEPVASITSPGGGKRMYLDPILGRCSRAGGCASSTMRSRRGHRSWPCIDLLARLDVEIAAVVVAMKQTNRWLQPLNHASPGLAGSVRAVFGCPLFSRSAEGWFPSTARCRQSHSRPGPR